MRIASPTLFRVAARALLLTVATAVATGCATVASDTPPRLISFGDSLSDLGTYASRTEGRTAGRFTTNPGPLWIELVAAELGTSITAHRHAGWGKPAVVLGGTAYGEGGARVAHQPGSGNTDDTAGHESAQTTLPVREQITTHLASAQGRFGPRDLVFVWAGANDLFRYAAAESPEDGEAVMRQAARDLVAEVNRLVEAGAPKVVVLTMDDYGEVPATRNSPRRAVLSAWSQVFNDELAARLKGGAVLLVDAHALLRAARNDPARFGLKNGTTPACAIQELPRRSVNFCDANSLVEKDAHLTYLYADGVHPTTAGHQLIARHVMERLRAAGVK
jgi:outer membrane lipase/esterase